MDRMIGKKLCGCTIESKIGQGGMGSVYKAHHDTLNTTVAIKIFNFQSDIPGSKERFLREAQLMAKLRHPNIVSVMNAGIEDDIHFIIMEYIEGGNLLSLIYKKNVIPVPEAVSIATDILQALKLAKDNSIVHRDIKPENILIDANGKAKLADLGLARVINTEHLTHTNTMLGSPHYIAPEQIDNSSNVDYRSDIYSLGCTLFHMLSGKEPFPGGSLIEIVINHTRNPIPILNEVNKEIPQNISDAVYTMMQKDPEKRFQDPLIIIRTLSPDPVYQLSCNTETPSGGKHHFPIAAVVIIIILLSLLSLTALFTSHKDNFRAEVLLPQEDSSAVTTSQDTSRIVPDTTVAAPLPTPQKLTKKKKVAIPKPQTVAHTTVQIPPVTENPLIKVVKMGDTETLRSMLQKGVSPKCEQGTSTTPLHEAVRRGLTVETKLLVKNGAPVNVSDRSGNSPLHYAIKENAQYMVKILLENGADPNLKTRTGKTPLKMAQSIDSELESLLEKYGAR
ncbi:MAG: protein kinase [Chitinispirillaceae bacterium]|nr:protein kinase [Chitinispirillaceae bacterium]